MVNFLIKTKETKYGNKHRWYSNHFFLMPSRFIEFLKEVTIHSEKRDINFPMLSFNSGLRHTNCKVTEIVMDSADEHREEKKIIYQAKAFRDAYFCDDEFRKKLDAIVRDREKE